MSNTAPITVTNASDIVQGTLTSFVAAAGDILVVNGYVAVIKESPATDILVLEDPWPHATITNSLAWEIVPTAPYWNTVVTVNQQIVALIQRLEGGGILNVNGAGTLAKRATFDTQPEGFTYLRTDVDPFLLYVKLSATAGDWSTGQRLQADQAQSTYDAQQAAALAAQWAEHPSGIDVTTAGTRSAKAHSTAAQTANTAAGVSATNASRSETNARHLDADRDVTTNFALGLNGWTGNAATVTQVGAVMRVVTTATNPWVQKTGLSLTAGRYTRLIVRFRRTAGTGANDQNVYWSTAGHSWDGAHLAAPVGGVKTLTLNTWYENTYDLGASADWLGNVITGIRFDPGAATGDTYEVDYIILVGSDTAAPAKRAKEAADSATAAGLSEANAAGSATAASTSAGQAAGHVTTAAGHVTTASGHATAAGTARTAAEAARDLASNAATQVRFLDAEPVATTDFDTDANGMTAAGATIAWANGVVTITTTGADPQFVKSGLNFSGARYSRVVLRVRRTTGTSAVTASDAWSVYWSRTAPTVRGHGSYAPSPIGGKPSSITNGTWYELVYDMLSPSGTDWASSTIDSLRWEPCAASGEVWEVDYFHVVGPDIAQPVRNAAAAAASASAASGSASAASGSASAAAASATAAADASLINALIFG